MWSCRPCVLAAGAGLFLISTTLAQKSGAGSSIARDKVTFDAVCGSCHPASLVSGLHSEVEWKATIEQMVSVGAQLTDEQYERVMRYLLRTFTKVNVNSAAASEIAPVLDISEATAEALVKYRIEKGSFKQLEDLKKVPGIDGTKLDTRKDRVAFY